MSNAFDVIDFSAPAGQALKTLVEGRLGVLRAKLEGDLSERDTQETRGAIKELRRLLQAAPQAIASLRYSGMDFNKTRGMA